LIKNGTANVRTVIGGAMGRRAAQLVCKRCRAVICEFCESSFDASKTEQCYQCECGREGRNHPKDTTLREDCEETGRALKSVGLSKRVNPNPAGGWSNASK